MSTSNRLRVKDVTSDLSADRAGLRVNDIIISYDGKPMKSSDHLTRAVQEASAEMVLIEFSRRGALKETQIQKGRMGLYVEEFPFDEEEFQRESAWRQQAANLTKPTFQAAFDAYRNSNITINLLEPTKYTSATLIDAAVDHLMVCYNENIYRIPYSQVLNTMENPKLESITISINHLVIYKGASAVGFGIAIPLGF